jgi:ribonucleoside-diphosphate reductase beta chain
VHALAVSSVLVGYEHFLRVADRIAWTERDVDITDDAAGWPGLDPEWRDRVTAFVAAFALAEERVAVDLAPFIAAASDSSMADCFLAQARDEERHARFFDRYSRQVLGLDDLSDRVAPRFRELFEERLGAAAGELASGRLRLADAVALYHLVLEGVVFSAGQNALLAELRRTGDLPGLCDGMERVVADERWHIGFGVRVLRGNPGDVTKAIDAERAIGVWGDLLPSGQQDVALKQHHRRLAAAGLAG